MKSLLWFAIVLATSSASAQSIAPVPCMNSANTIERNICFGREVEAIEKLLATEVQRVGASMQKRDAEEPMFQLAPAFSTSQARWQEFRAAECNFRSLTFGYGTGAPVEGMLCHLEHGRARLEYLKGIR